MEVVIAVYTDRCNLARVCFSACPAPLDRKYCVCSVPILHLAYVILLYSDKFLMRGWWWNADRFGFKSGGIGMTLSKGKKKKQCVATC